MKNTITPEEHARIKRRRWRQTLGLLITVLVLIGFITVLRAGVGLVANLFDDTALFALFGRNGHNRFRNGGVKELPRGIELLYIFAFQDLFIAFQHHFDPLFCLFVLTGGKRAL